MSSVALDQIAAALQNGIGLSISTTGYTWDQPPPIGFGEPNSALFTNLSTTYFTTSTFTATAGITGTAIGQTNSNVGYFTLLTASTITGPVGQVTSNSGNFTALQTSSFTANTINSASIGLTTSNSGYFTDLRASSFSTNTAFVTTANISTLNVSTVTLANSILATTSTITVSGLFSNTGITAVQEIIETLNLKSTTTGLVTHDWSTGAIWYHSSMTANFSVALTNVPLTTNRSLVTTLILNQGATPYYANGLTINGTAVPIKWPSATAPTATASRTEVESLTMFYIGTTWTALGQYTSFG